MIASDLENRKAEVTLKWADGNHIFRLHIGQWKELQEKCSCGPQELLTRLLHGGWRFEDVRETIRIGLIGGGMAPLEALALVERYVDPHPAQSHLQEAIAIAMAGNIGSADEPVGGKKKRRPRPRTPAPS